jgi:predicted enzyme related to lactoylglutathione lyase
MTRTIRRVVPDLETSRPEELRRFYTEVIGLEVGMDLGWIVGLGSATHESAQLNVMTHDAHAQVTPQISIEVDDVDAVHEGAVHAGAAIAYPLTDEPWGVRRFFLLDPDGRVVNVMQHRRPMDES